MRKRYNNPKLKFYIGDVRDSRSVPAPCGASTYVFHAAALKQVPSCEFHPMEAVGPMCSAPRTCWRRRLPTACKRVVCLSTDKAVYPINAMGIPRP